MIRIIIYTYISIIYTRYRHIHSNQVIIAIIVYEKGKRRMPQESKSFKTLSELLGMTWCMFIRARLLNCVSFLVLRRYVFNLRKQLKDLSAVAVETGIVRSTEEMAWMFGNMVSVWVSSWQRSSSFRDSVVCCHISSSASTVSIDHHICLWYHAISHLWADVAWYM